MAKLRQQCKAVFEISQARKCLKNGTILYSSGLMNVKKTENRKNTPKNG